MKGWTGLALFLAGAGLAYAGLAQRGRVLARRREAEARGVPEPGPRIGPQLAMMGEIFPPMICTVLVLVGVKMSLMYAMVGENRLFNVLDLAGFLALLAGYGTWIVCTTRFRELKETAAPVPAARPAEVVSLRGSERDELGHARAPGDAAGAGRRPGVRGVGAPVGQREEAA